MLLKSIRSLKTGYRWLASSIGYTVNSTVTKLGSIVVKNLEDQHITVPSNTPPHLYDGLLETKAAFNGHEMVGLLNLDMSQDEPSLVTGCVIKSHITDRLTSEMLCAQRLTMLMIKHLDDQIIAPHEIPKFKTRLEKDFSSIKSHLPNVDGDWEECLGNGGMVGLFEKSDREGHPDSYAIIVASGPEDIHNELIKLWQNKMVDHPELTCEDFMYDRTRTEANELVLKNAQRIMYRALQTIGQNVSTVQDMSSVHYGSLEYGPPLLVDLNDIDIVQYSNCSNLTKDGDHVLHNLGASFATNTMNTGVISLSPVHGLIAVSGDGLPTEMDALPLTITPGSGTHDLDYKELDFAYNMLDSVYSHDHPVESHPSFLDIGKVPSNRYVESVIELLAGVPNIDVTRYRPICCKLG